MNIMARYHANIVTLVDHADIYCNEHDDVPCKGCSFDKDETGCVYFELATLLGVET